MKTRRTATQIAAARQEARLLDTSSLSFSRAARERADRTGTACSAETAMDVGAAAFEAECADIAARYGTIRPADVTGFITF